MIKLKEVLNIAFKGKDPAVKLVIHEYKPASYIMFRTDQDISQHQNQWISYNKDCDIFIYKIKYNSHGLFIVNNKLLKKQLTQLNKRQSLIEFNSLNDLKQFLSDTHTNLAIYRDKPNYKEASSMIQGLCYGYTLSNIILLHFLYF